MKEEEQQAAFYNDLCNLIRRYIDEFGMTYISFLGAMTMVINEMAAASREGNDDGTD